MKVLYVIPGLGAGGGSERSLLAVVPAIRQAGIELVIAYFVTRPEDNAAAYADAGARVIKLDATSLAERVRRLRALVRAEQPDVVHTTLYEADLAGRLACIGLPARVIGTYTAANYDPARRQDPTYRWTAVEAVRWFAAVTARHLAVGGHAVSDAARQAAARSFGVPVDEIEVVHRGRHLDDFAEVPAEAAEGVRRELGLDPDQPLVVSVGRHEFQKDQLTVVEAMSAVVAARPGAVLAVAGREGAMTSALRARIAELGLDGAVRLLGPRSDVPAILAAADVVAFSSILEGFSGVLVEAVASGRPLVATAIPPNRELLGGTGVPLVPPGDAAALAEALLEALADPATARARTTAARDAVRTWVSVDHAAAGMVALYRSLEAPGSRVQASDAPGRHRQLIVVPDLAAAGPDLLDDVVALRRSGVPVSVATFGGFEGAAAWALEDGGTVVHRLGATSQGGRALALRRLGRALRPVRVDLRTSDLLLRIASRQPRH